MLSDEQEQLIQRAIIDKRPEQLKLDFYLWSRSAVAQLIEQECDLKLSERTVGKYLKRWGFTPQKPIKKAYEQRPEPRPCKPGWTSIILPLPPRPRPKAARFTAPKGHKGR